MSLKSTLGIAKNGTKSLRTTVPEGIVAYLVLEAGDKLEWKMGMEGIERVVIIHKARKDSTSASKGETQ